MPNANALSKIKEPIRILRRIKSQVTQTAIIAGGYYRDIYNDVKYNDVDIYLRGAYDEFNTDYWKNLFELKTHGLGLTDSIAKLSETDEEYDVENNADIIEVYGMIKNEINYNLIIVACNPIQYVHERFDFGICKVYCDGNKIRFTQAFMEDVNNKTLTFSDCDFTKSNFNHAMHVHLSKLKEKYPEHTVVMPEKHQKQYQEPKRFITT